ncbi:hypothetical protein PISL3812_00185 [Talaromyces islandicus]|uniref:Peptidase A1 domain-containing protein n=1 Tax=Talaromyces islandicus TaxID=28573 RepID=A0A0U1LII8_TALIS|nr:hypothetical protein PISL3812_00185 [Talaromyces islandicus]
MIKLGLSLVAFASTQFVTCHASPNVLPLRRRSNHGALLNVTGADLYNIFDTEVTIGNQTFVVQVDTGSSDLWVLQDGWQCINGTTNSEIPQADCTFGNATYKPSPTLEIIEDGYFGVVYGAGNALGALAYEDVTLGGITVQQQIIGLVNSTFDTGSGIDAGVMGFGYPVLTMAHFGSKFADNDSQALLLNRTTYDPIFTRMWKQGLVEPWFSLALERPSPDDEVVGTGGYLGLGELASVSYDTDSWAVKPVEVTNGIPGAFTNNTQEITEWTLSVDGVFWAPADNVSNSSVATSSTPGFGSNSTAFQAVVDSGQPLNLLPPEIIDEVHALFDPPVYYDATSRVYVASCDSKPPRLGIQLAGRVFWHKPEDLIMSVGDGSCSSALYPTGSSSLGVSFNFLGDAFLRNVLAVFDFGNDEMRFASRSDGGGVSLPETSNVGVSNSLNSKPKGSDLANYYQIYARYQQSGFWVVRVVRQAMADIVVGEKALSGEWVRISVKCFEITDRMIMSFEGRSCNIADGEGKLIPNGKLGPEDGQTTREVEGRLQMLCNESVGEV